MYEYDLQHSRTADLIRRAEQERLAREAVRVRRAARREAADRAPEAESHRPRSRRPWFARTA